MENGGSRNIVIQQGIIGAALYCVLIDAETGGSIGLRVEINNQHLLAHLREVRTEVDGGRGLAHSTFLIDEGINASHIWLWSQSLCVRRPCGRQSL